MTSSQALTTPLLPPRKRYKVVGNGGGSSSEILSSSGEGGIDASDAYIASTGDGHRHRQHTQPDNSDGDGDYDEVQDDNAVGRQPKKVIEPIATIDLTSTAKKRPRGRPSKRASYSPSGRPKREVSLIHS